METKNSSGLGYYRWLYERLEKEIGERVLVAGPACDKFVAQLGPRKLVRSIQEDLSGSNHPNLARSTFDTVICLNALERAASDSVALQHIHGLLIPDGTAIFLVPTLPRLSRFIDPRGVIRHRYTKNQIFEKLDQHRFHLVSYFYFNSFGILFPHHRTNLEDHSFLAKLAEHWNGWEKKLNLPIGRSLVIVTKTKLPARG